jgi:LPS sulfotransferase NodH
MVATEPQIFPIHDYIPRPTETSKLWREFRRIGRQGLGIGQLLGPANIRFQYRRLRNQLHLLNHWWLHAHTPYQPVFVIATPRSGSNLLVDYLKCLPGVDSYWEILLRQMYYGPKPGSGPAKALKHIRYSFQALQSPVRCCKIFFEHFESYHLTLRALDEAFPGAKYIVLYRQSLAEQFASHELARLTNQWAIVQGQVAKQKAIAVDRQKLLEYCDKMRSNYQNVISTPWLIERAVLLSYEELTADPAYWIHYHIGPLLGVSTTTLRTRFAKQNPQPLSERITNYSEVAALLKSPRCQQRYAWPARNVSLRRAA